ncbi:hypothetical protein [Leptospira santarosai]|uniref:hypothetical protein n=1 Tax=Leptospira santarosai TaxID=28183 RepID=UPI000773837C
MLFVFSLVFSRNGNYGFFSKKLYMKLFVETDESKTLSKLKLEFRIGFKSFRKGLRNFKNFE